MAEQAAGGGHQHHLPALTLLEHAAARSARHQPALGDVDVHHVQELLGLHVCDLRHDVLARTDDENVEAAETGDRRGDDGVGMRLAVGTKIDRLDLSAQLPATPGGRGEPFAPAGGEHEPRARAGQRERSDASEGAARPGHNRNLARDIEQRLWGTRPGIVGRGVTPAGC